MTRAIFVLLLCLLGNIGFSQAVPVINKSFEGFPKKGVPKEAFNLDGWEDCGKLNFYDVTPPDIHPQDYWKVKLAPSDGKTYIGLVVRPNMTYESISQKLGGTLKADNCYAFSMDCVKSDSYKSPIAGDTQRDYNFTTPVVIRIFGSKTSCYHRQGSIMPEPELLAISPPISNTNVWQSYVFTVKPKKDYDYITIEAFYHEDAQDPYKGHVCIDNATDFIPIGCNDENALVTAFIDANKKDDVIALKENKVTKKTTIPASPDIKKEIQDEKPALILKKEKPTPKKEKILTDLNKEIKAGQKIRIENLFFAMDSVSVPKEAYDVLDEIYEFLISNKDISIEVGGHTNGLPKHNYCDKLSTERAKEVATYLIQKGIKAARISYKGYGKRKPIASNKTAKGRAQNQRVEVKILTVD